MQDFIDWFLRFVALAGIGIVVMKVFVEAFFLGLEWYIVLTERD